jgi:hypothetical protein
MTTKPDYSDNAFFSMKFIASLQNEKDLTKAKERAYEEVKAKSNARPKNIAKANAQIANAKNIKQLMQGCVNFQLAHDGLGVIK